MAGSIKVLGTSVWAVRMPSILLSTGLIVLFYFFALQLLGSTAAYWAAGIAAINSMLVEVPSGRIATDHVDMMFLFLTTAAGFLILRNQTRLQAGLWIGLLLGFAILTKWLIALFLVPVYLIIHNRSLWKRDRRQWIQLVLLLGIAGIMAFAWFGFAAHQYPMEYQWESQYNRLHLWKVLEGQERPQFYFFEQLGFQAGVLVYVSLPCFFLFAFREKEIEQSVSFALLFWVVVFLVVFTIAATKMPLYILPILPISILSIAFCMEWLGRCRIGPRLKQVLMLILVCFLLTDSIVKTEIYKESRAQNEELSQERNALQTYLQGHESKNPVVLNARNPIELMFFEDVTAYGKIPDSLTLDRVAEHRSVIVLSHEGENVEHWQSLKPYTLIKVSAGQ